MKETAEAMAVRYLLDFKGTKTHWIITWRLEESENYDRFGMEDGRSWMSRLALVTDELLRGDIRSLYIGWLAAVTGEMIDDDEMEPLPVYGLGSLTDIDCGNGVFRHDGFHLGFARHHHDGRADPFAGARRAVALGGTGRIL